MYHFRKKRKLYLKNIETDSCPFCDRSKMTDSVQETAHVLVVPNKTFYDLWETHKVVDHLLIVPKRHVIGLNELTEAERKEVMDIMAEYDAKGYNVYARAPGSVRKTVDHQHTHLIKITGNLARFYLAVKKPHLLIRF